ncbi:MAG: glycosyltransferase family 2 protein [Ignavibacteriae bacterium]|nr:glycosyltransferase family 2 protein [Ignavibacteriota bacterium]
MVSIIILNYNGKGFLMACLDSILKQTFTDFEIILFDNCSSDSSVSFLKENYSTDKVNIVVSEKNLGFAGGNNEALKHSKGEYVVLLNNDTVVEENWLAELVSSFEVGPTVGIAQSLVYTEGIPLKYFEMNGTLNLFGHNIMRFFDVAPNGIGDIFMVTGCSLIVKREVLNEVNGLFLDEYFAYAEDSFLSFKIKFAGYRSIHNANSVVRHLGGATMKKYKSRFVTYYQERNRILNFLIFFSDSFRRKYYPYLLYNLLLKFSYSIFFRKYSFIGLIKAYFWIIRNSEWIESRRIEMNKIKRVKEEDVLKILSGKIANGDNLLEVFLNKISLTYLKLVNIKVFESN